MSSTKSELAPGELSLQSARAARPILLFSKSSPSVFRKRVWNHFKEHGRHDLPWRKTRDPYKILVSEVMLQQTQVKRAIPFYAEFTRRFPTARRLADAPLSEVLKSWQGLGYNRRAKMLHLAAKKFPRFDLATMSNLVGELEKLPGVGSYTARAVAAFAFNQDVGFVETNIRTAIIHHFFNTETTMIYHSGKQKVSDTEIEKILKIVLPKGEARAWYGALMDYGSHLKQLGVKLNAKSKHYAKRSKFAGSLREARGVILRELAKGKPCQDDILTWLLGRGRRIQMRTALSALLAEQLIQKRGRVFTLPR